MGPTGDVQRWEGPVRGVSLQGQEVVGGKGWNRARTIQKRGQQKHVWMLQPSCLQGGLGGQAPLRGCDVLWMPPHLTLTRALVEFCTRPWSNLQKRDGAQLGPDATKRYSCRKVSLLLHPPDAPGPSPFRVHTEKPRGIWPNSQLALLRRLTCV